MKKLTLLFTVFFATLYINAQNVAINNDGTSAAGSAMLDVKSTTKGFMMPRMASSERTAIQNPVLGLLVFDINTKTIWTYDGSSWKNLYTSGGGLVLPFSQTVITATSALEVSNQGVGAAIEGSSTTQFGIGMTAKTTGEGGWGLFAFSNGAGSQSIRSYADNGTAFHGENNNSANTNTLMNLINKGAGKTGSFQLANSSSTSPNVQIAGNHLGHQLKIYQTNASNTEAAVSIENSGTGTSIEATSTTGDGVIGTSNTGYGVKGLTTTALGKAGVHGQNNGTAGSGVVGVSNAANTQGVYGTSNNGTGVRGLSSSGTALSGNSATGYALETNGKVKIAGGNTNPGEGKVLTSDANGNATWQQSTTQKIAFRGQGSNIPFNTLPVDNWYKVIFSGESYDFGNNFTSYAGALPFADASLFTVPSNGVYTLGTNLLVLVNGALLEDDFSAYIRIGIIRNGNTFYTEDATPYEVSDIDSDPDQISAQLKVSTEMYLNAGDKVFVHFKHSNSENASAIVANYPHLTYFYGRLAIAD
jgi:hypothetical protein